MDLMVLATNLKRIRDERGLTQSELCSLAGIQPRTYTDLEKGRNKPHNSTIIMLANALKVNPSELTGENVETSIIQEPVTTYGSNREKQLEIENQQLKLKMKNIQSYLDTLRIDIKRIEFELTY